MRGRGGHGSPSREGARVAGPAGSDDPAARARRRFREVFPDASPPGVATAPGRVNLIGEHTDYNDGFVLPMAIDRRVAVAFLAREDNRVRVHAALFSETLEVDLSRLEPRTTGTAGGDRIPAGGLPDSSEGWLARVAGVWWAARREGVEAPSLDLVVDGDVPVGAGLSSSAALEVAVARALFHAAGAAWDPAAVARIAREVESRFGGVSCGLMDPFVAAAGRRDHALLLDCRSLESRAVHLPEAAAVLVLDTGVRRELAAGAYNERRDACRRAVELLRGHLPGVRALRDVTPADLEAHGHRLDPVTYRRARHVVEENRRPEALAARLREGDLEAAGRLMDASHASLRELYEVSSPELDAFVAAAREDGRCFGARMTGAGFGGCAVALVRREDAAEVAEDALARYREATGRRGAAFPVRAAGGARVEAGSGA